MWSETSAPKRYGGGEQLANASAAAPYDVGLDPFGGRPPGALHTFRRAIATALVEALGVGHASRVVGDAAEVIMRHLPRGAPNQAPEAASEPRQGRERPDGGRPSPAATGLTEQARRESLAI